MVYHRPAPAIIGNRECCAPASIVTKGDIMPYLEALPLKRRYGEMSSDRRPDASCREFCRYDFPRCDGCPDAVRAEPICSSFEDPMQSMVVRGWIHGMSQPSK